MSKMSRLTLILAVAAIVVGAAQTPAQAQYQYQTTYGAADQTAPLYPYAVVPQVNSYGVQPQILQQPRVYPYIRTTNAPRILRRSVRRTDPALVEQLRRRTDRAGVVINKRIVVRERPVVIEHQRIVDDPPVVVRRERVIEEAQPQRQAQAQARPPRSRAEKMPGTPRIIRAEAEITILGPDRMSIRLFRSRGESASQHAQD